MNRLTMWAWIALVIPAAWVAALVVIVLVHALTGTTLRGLELALPVAAAAGVAVLARRERR